MTNVVAVVFAHNERGRIGTTLEILTKYKREGRIKNIVVVNDGSTDGTKEAIEKFGVIVVNHKTNLGKREAFISGAVQAKKLGAEVMLSLDADIVKFPRKTLENMVQSVTTRKNLMSIAEQHEVYPMEEPSDRTKVTDLHSNAQRAINIKALDPLFNGDPKWMDLLKSKAKEPSRAKFMDYNSRAGPARLTADSETIQKGSKWGLEYALNKLIPPNKRQLLSSQIMTRPAFREHGCYGPQGPLSNSNPQAQIYGREIVQGRRELRTKRAEMLWALHGKSEQWKAARKKQLGLKALKKRANVRRLNRK